MMHLIIGQCQGSSKLERTDCIDSSMFDFRRWLGRMQRSSSVLAVFPTSPGAPTGSSDVQTAQMFESYAAKAP